MIVPPPADGASAPKFDADYIAQITDQALNDAHQFAGEYALPISIKGVIVTDDGIVLLRNDRDEWELPGGRLEPGESPPVCLAREIREELGWDVSVERILAAWPFEVVPGKTVFVVAYLCTPPADRPSVTISDEHEEAGFFAPDQLDALALPAGYRAATRAAVGIERSRRQGDQ